MQEELNTAIIANQLSLNTKILGDQDRVDQDKVKLEAAANDIMGINQEMQNKIAEEQQKAVEKLAGSIDQFINRFFVQAKSLSDVFNQFLMQVVSSVIKSFSQMVAASLLSVQQAGAQGSSGFLGLLLGGQKGSSGSGILGSLFGLGGSSATSGNALVGGGALASIGLAGGTLGAASMGSGSLLDALPILPQVCSRISGSVCFRLTFRVRWRFFGAAWQPRL